MKYKIYRYSKFHRYEIHVANKNIHISKYFVFGNHEVEIFKNNLGIKEINPLDHCPPQSQKNTFK